MRHSSAITSAESTLLGIVIGTALAWLGNVLNSRAQWQRDERRSRADRQRRITVHLHLGHTAESAEHLTAAIAQRDQADAKGRALLTFDLAECAIRSGQPDHAADLAHQALDTAAGQYVRPIVDRAKALHAQLAGFPQVVAGYGDRIREPAPAALPRQKERP